MAAILKSTKGKDMLILKHSEVRFWYGLDDVKKAAVKKAAHIFIYFGYFTPVRKAYGFEDGWITLKDTVADIPEQLKWLDFGGINFLKSPLGADLKKQAGSLCCITNDTPRKGLHNFLLALLFCKAQAPLSLVVQQNANTLRDRIYAGCLFVLVQFVRMKFGKNLSLYRSGVEGRLSRSDVYGIIARSEHLVLPSYAEGAARVVGEAHLHQTRVIMRHPMKGSTHLFLTEYDERYRFFWNLISKLQNRRYQEFSDDEISKHCERFLASNQEASFFNAAESAGIHLEPVSLVDLFSGQKNILPSSVTGADDSDQIIDQKHMINLVDYLTKHVSQGSLHESK